MMATLPPPNEPTTICYHAIANDCTIDYGYTAATNCSYAYGPTDEQRAFARARWQEFIIGGRPRASHAALTRSPSLFQLHRRQSYAAISHQRLRRRPPLFRRASLKIVMRRIRQCPQPPRHRML